MGKKKALFKLVAFLFVFCLTLECLPGKYASAAGTVDFTYYNYRTRRESTLFADGLQDPIMTLEANTPLHLTGKEDSRECMDYDEDGNVVEGIITFYQVELTDGTIGWLSKGRIEQAIARKDAYMKSDQYLRSEADSSTSIAGTAFEGEKINILETEGKYSRIEIQKKKVGWVPSASLVTKVPKYLYAKNPTPFYYNNELKKSLFRDTAWIGECGVMPTGTKMEYVTTAVDNGLEEYVYLVITPTKQLAFVDVKDVSYALPTTLYIKQKTTLYAEPSSKGKGVGSVAQGTKVSRQFSEGSYYKVKMSNGKQGWIKKSHTSTEVTAKAVKNYGKFYTIERTYVEKGKNKLVYPTGTMVTRVDPYYYPWKGTDSDRLNKYSDLYFQIKCQYPDGNITYLDYGKNGELVRNYKDSQSTFRKGTVHLEEMEQLIFKQLNDYRKSKGKNEVKWDDLAYKYASSYFNYCLEAGNGLPHVVDDYGWSGDYTDIILPGAAVSTEEAKEMAMNAMGSWKRSAGHNRMLLDDFNYVAVIVMYNEYSSNFEAAIYYTEDASKIDFARSNDNYMAKTWYPFIFDKPKFTEKRGKEYTGHVR